VRNKEFNSRILSIVAMAGILPVWADAWGQAYPSKTIRIVVGSTPGGAVDTVARLLLPKLSEQLGQPVLVENRAGASGAIATERVIKAPPDGYSLTLLSSNAVILSVLRPDLPYSVEKDLAPISLVASAPLALVVHPSLPARNVKEFIALAKSRPGSLDFAHTGVGSVGHIAGELLNSLAKIQLNQVAYKGAAEAVIATAAGEVPINLPSVTSAMSLLGTGKFRVLAVTSATRSTLMPSIPTLSEAGVPGYDFTVWFGVFTSTAVSKEIIQQLNTTITKVVQTPEMKTAINNIGQEPLTSTVDQFNSFMRSETDKFRKLVKLAKLI
jgi:tripartite-type tricarboxylate transporter receptor subunit TctC